MDENQDMLDITYIPWKYKDKTFIVDRIQLWLSQNIVPGKCIIDCKG